MKSQQQDKIIKTNCKNCAFALYDDSNKTQVSCSFDRVSKFQPNVTEAYDDDKQFFVINRLCTYYRDKAWGYSVIDTEKVVEESSLSFDLIFDCNEIDTLKTNNIINFLEQCTYNKNKINIFLIHESNKYNIVKEYISNIARKSKFKINISIYSNIDEYAHQLIMHSKCTYHCFIKSDCIPNASMLNEINNKMNNDLQRFIVADYNGIILINNFIYKSGFHLEQIKYSKLVNKIIDQSKETNMYIEM